MCNKVCGEVVIAREWPITRSHVRRRARAAAPLALITVLCSIALSAGAQDLSNLPNEKPVGFAGAITASSTAYTAGGIDDRRQPFSWTIAGSPTLSLYGVQMPFSFVISEQERSFRQPFDQFGVSPTYKSFTAHLGYRAMTLDRYSLAGVSFLGAGVEGNPGPVRFAAMYGRVQRAVAEDTTNITIQPAYERMGYGGKLGFGNTNTFVDLIYFHAKDDSNSLGHPPRMTDHEVLTSQVFPQENAVFALNSRVGIIDELTFELDVAASALTRDLRAPALDSNKIPSSVASFIDVKSSTSVSLAGQTALTLRVPHLAVRLGYERIEPDYTSLGAYYFNTDIENYTLAPSFDLFDNKLRVSGSIGIQHDDVLKNKLAQTSRVIGSSAVSWTPGQTFGLDLNYANYSTDQGGGLRPINDTIRVRNVSQSASIAPHYIIMGDDISQVISLVSSVQQYTDLNAYTNQFSNSNSVTAALSYNRTMLKLGSGLGGTLLFANTITSQVSTHVFGGSLNGSLQLFEKKMTLGASLGYTHNVVSTISTASGTFSETLSTTYQVTDADNVSLSTYATQNTSSQFQPTPYHELTATLSFTHSFAY